VSIFTTKLSLFDRFVARLGAFLCDVQSIAKLERICDDGDAIHGEEEKRHGLIVMFKTILLRQ
jgi:hypothetical protein